MHDNYNCVDHCGLLRQVCSKFTLQTDLQTNFGFQTNFHYLLLYAANIHIYLIIIFSIINVKYKTANFHYEKFYFFILKDLILAKVPGVARGNLETLEKIILNQWFPYKISAIFVELFDQLQLKYIYKYKYMFMSEGLDYIDYHVQLFGQLQL